MGNNETQLEEKNENTQDSLEQSIEDILEGIPKEGRHEIRKMIGMSMQMGGIISPEMELMKKMTPEHVTEFLGTQKVAMENQFKESRENKIFLAFVLLVVLGFIIILIHLLKDKPEVMEKVLFTLGGLITGLFGGYGIGKSKRDE